jgi:hypothetical protein
MASWQHQHISCKLAWRAAPVEKQSGRQQRKTERCCTAILALRAYVLPSSRCAASPCCCVRLLPPRASAAHAHAAPLAPLAVGERHQSGGGVVEKRKRNREKRGHRQQAYGGGMATANWRNNRSENGQPKRKWRCWRRKRRRGGEIESGGDGGAISVGISSAKISAKRKIFIGGVIATAAKRLKRSASKRISSENGGGGGVMAGGGIGRENIVAWRKWRKQRKI